MTVDRLTVIPDVPAHLANWLRTALAGRTERYVQRATVGTRTPDTNAPAQSRDALVVVTQDGPGEMQGRANARATIRIAVWHPDADDAYDAAALCHALILTHRSAAVRSVLPALSPDATTDPDTDQPMAWFTVTANARPQAL